MTVGRRSASKSDPSANGEYPRRVSLGDGIYARVDRRTGRRVPESYEYVYRDSSSRQRWKRASGKTKAAARAERAETVARVRLGQRTEYTTLTVSQTAELWLERGSGQHGRWAPPTHERYRRIVRLHIDAAGDEKAKPIGTYKLRELTIDRVAAWSRANETTLAPTTARTALVVLNQICRFAVRRGWLADNPVSKLESAEKPPWKPKQVAILQGDELKRLLDTAGSSRPLFEFLSFTGLRIGEALGLVWNDIDFDAGFIRVHRQLSRQRLHAPLKTPGSKREVILAPPIAKLLRERWLASEFKRPEDFVFANALGQPLDYRVVGEQFRATIKRAGISPTGKLILHSFRHGFASLLISKGLDVVFVSRQLGHTSPRITLETYAHEFAAADHATAARAALDASYTAINESGLDRQGVVTAVETDAATK
jgi:integrase